MKWEEIEAMLFRYWDRLPEPKKNYTQWWYSDGGIRDMLQTYHQTDPEFEARFKVTTKFKGPYDTLL